MRLNAAASQLPIADIRSLRRLFGDWMAAVRTFRNYNWISSTGASGRSQTFRMLALCCDAVPKADLCASRSEKPKPDYRDADIAELLERSAEPAHQPLFTGFRKTEALTLEWRNINEDHIHVPMTKNGRSFDLPILQVHHEILAPIISLHRKWVFPSPKSAAGHMTNPEKIAWSPHAHRRTFATVAM